MYILKNCFYGRGDSGYYGLMGNIYGRDEYEDGDCVMTSRPTELHFELDEIFIRTQSGSEYYLESFLCDREVFLADLRKDIECLKQ